MQEQNAMKKSPNAKGIASLTKQYQKLQRKLQRAFSTGRFQSYSQYKQQSLLNRLLGYTSQLKKLGLAAAVCTGMAVATPAVGQTINFLPRTGVNNPFDTIYYNGRYANLATGALNPSDYAESKIEFVDLDADGDLDVVLSRWVDFLPSGGYVDAGYMDYYENIGTATAPNFVPSANNPFDSVGQQPVFADIDNDGDIDYFADNDEYYFYLNGSQLQYYENVGTATVPNFVKRTGAQNPLDSVNILNTGTGYNYGPAASANLVDLDGDSDLDYIHVTNTTNSNLPALYFENIGTASNPIFTDQTANSIFVDSTGTRLYGGSSSTSPATLGRPVGSINFIDLEGDNDLDMVADHLAMLVNIGTASSPSFARRTGSANFYNQLGLGNLIFAFRDFRLVDIDADGDLDAVGIGKQSFSGNWEWMLMENRTIVLANNKFADTNIALTISPNPSTGLLQLDRPVTGQAAVYTTTGQLVYTKAIEAVQTINLEGLDNGIYILRIHTEEGWIQEKIVLQK